MPKPISMESILRMNVPALRRNTVLIMPMCLVMTTVCLVLGARDEVLRPMWWTVAAGELFLGTVMSLARLRYLTVIETVQRYMTERDRAEHAAHL